MCRLRGYHRRMPAGRSRRWVVALAVAGSLLFASVPALALTPVPDPRPTLTFVRNPLKPVIYAAFEDGSGVHRLAAGRNPRFLPDGQTIAYLHEGPGGAQELRLVPAAGGASRLLMRNWRESDQIAFGGGSPTIAALRGPEIGKRKLVLIDVYTGAQRTVASGYFSGFSFSPNGDELVYARSAKEGFPMRSDIFQVPIAGGQPVRITDDGRSQNPLWGPDKIVFSKLLGARQRRYGPKSELYLMNPGGRSVQRLTHTKVGPLLLGLFPTEWGWGGNNLLAEFEGQDTSYAVAVNPKTGAHHAIAATGERGFVGTALSGTGQVLGFTGGFEPGPGHKVVSIPYAGGRATVLADNAFEPDWSY